MSAKNRLAALEADFKEKISGDLIEIPFPESGSSIFVRGKCSAFKKQPVLQAAASNQFDKFNALMIVQFALEENGKSVFNNGHVDALIKKMDSVVLERVANEIAAANRFSDHTLEDAYMEVDEAEKNSPSQSILDSGSI